MNLLLDTHVFIWFGAGDARLGRANLRTISDPDNRVFVSVVSRWEIELKRTRHAEFELPEPFDSAMARSGFLPLDLLFAVPSLLATLPDIHRDPFDRLLVAQALHHDLFLVTSDSMISRYPVNILW